MVAYQYIPVANGDTIEIEHSVKMAGKTPDVAGEELVGMALNSWDYHHKKDLT